MTDGAFRPVVAGLLACRDRALLLITAAFGATVTAAFELVTASLGEEELLRTSGFAAVWVPAGSVLLLGRSSGFDTAGPEAPAFVPPLFSLLPSEEELRLVVNPFTGSFDAVVAVGAAGRPPDPGAGCRLAVGLELGVGGPGETVGDRSAVGRGFGRPGL